MTETISLLNMKGGVGKTTLAVTLARYAYVRRGKRVLLIDFDPQFNSSQHLMHFKTYENHVRNKGTIAKLLIESPTLRLQESRERVSPSDCIARLDSKTRNTVYFDMLPSQLALAHVVKNPAQMDFKLEKVLQALRSKYDYVFIDCAPTDSVLTTMALTASNFILVPVKPDRFSILGFANLFTTIEQFRDNSQNPNDVKELGIVFTQVAGNSQIESECMDEVRRQARSRKWYVFSSTLDYSTTYQRAIRDRTAPFETKHARDSLKRNISLVVGEMEKRIAQLRKAKVRT